MMEKDEEIQKMLENEHVVVDTSADVEAYKLVFKALKAQQEFTLPSSFVENVVAKIEAKQKRATLKETILFSIGGLLLCGSLIGSIILTEYKINLDFLKYLKEHQGIFTFGVSFVLLLHLLDKFFIRDRQRT